MGYNSADVKSIFLDAIEHPPDQRAAYLDSVCAENAPLRARVEELLQAHAQLGGHRRPPASTSQGARCETIIVERLDQTIGRYRLLDEIGEGGMGVVYLAEQQEPVRRPVALKVIKPGMDTRAVVARFEAERQALALMDHPNIAHVFDAGETDSGRPYFVMELVQGLPLTDYCDEYRLPTRERLDLFVQVCRAVEHAHQKGIIHRDLKPSNVIVAVRDGTAVPKIIDFGIAKATGRGLAQEPHTTGLGVLIGTPLYMSPEQAGLDGADVDTRSDVYSLGVILYKLLTGTTPLEQQRAREAGYDEVRRMIREEEPPRPSDRISTLDETAAATLCDERRTDAARLRRSLRHDLDWIVMKALEKDRARRYQTAGEFARDVERYLADEPIEARPPGLGDRAARWARRHRPLVWSAAVLVAACALGSLVSTLLIAGAYDEKNRQLEATSRAEQLANQQRDLAQQQKRLAEEQKKEALRQRDAAENGRYVADMRLARHHWNSGQSARVLQVLSAQVPRPGRADPRGWEWHYLLSQCCTERLAFPFQSAQTVAWSPDGKHLATHTHLEGAWIDWVSIWDASTGKRKAVLKLGLEGIQAICWSPGGQHLAAATDDGRIGIYDTASGNLVRWLPGHEEACFALDWNPDGVRLASGGTDGTIHIWDTRSGKALSTLTAPGKVVWSLDWHPAGQHLLAVLGVNPNIAQELKIWDVSTGAQVVGWPTNGQRAAFSPDGTRVAWGALLARVTDWKTGRLISSFQQRGDQGSAWSPAGSRLASPADGGPLHIWDAGTGHEIVSLPARMAPGGRVAWSTKGSLLAAGCERRTVAVWDVDAARQALTLPTGQQDRYALAVRFSPDGKRLLAGIRWGLLKVYDAQSGAATLTLQQPVQTWIRCVAWSPDGRRFAAPRDDGVVTATNSLVLIYDAATGNPVSPQLMCEDQIAMRSLAWSPDGKTIAVGLRKDLPGVPFGRGRVVLFSADTGEQIAALPYADWGCDGVAWRPDGKRLAATGKRLRVWDAALREVPHPIDKPAVCLAWSPDGSQLAIADGNTPDHGDGSITIYDAASWAPLVEIVQPWDDVATLAWHPRWPRLASGSQRGTVHIWDTTTGQQVLALETSAEEVYHRIQQLDWSPDGLRLAAASQDCTVRVWDASRAEQVLKRQARRAQLEALAAAKKHEQAIALVERLRKLEPDDVEWRLLAQSAQLAYANQLVRDGQPQAATAVYRQLSADSPELLDHRLWLPAALYHSGKQAEAIEMLERLVAQSPKQAEYRDALAHWYEARAVQLCRAGQFEQALAVLRKLAAGFPERPDFRGRIAFSLAMSGRLEDTVAALEKIAGASRWPDYRPALARRLARAGRAEDAAFVYGRLASDYPNVAEYRTEAAGLLGLPAKAKPGAKAGAVKPHQDDSTGKK
ncbi:MAG: protein kinase [Thermoguttaceae bacterium]|jgi:WD40 repeat protein|nr:protein kinase [Thermoguttaceae bacterium]